MTSPTEKQFRQLLVLADGAMALAPGRRDWSPLLRRGWVAPVKDDDGGRFLPPLRITAEGLRALAAGVERFGLPEIGSRRSREPRPYSEYECDNLLHDLGESTAAKRSADGRFNELLGRAFDAGISNAKIAAAAGESADTIRMRRRRRSEALAGAAA